MKIKLFRSSVSLIKNFLSRLVTSKPTPSTSEPKWLLAMRQIAEEKDKTRFIDLSLSESILQCVHDLGFQYCSPIQAEILPHTLQGKDAIGKAQTGTGKTAAFLITIIDRLLKNPVPTERFLAEPRALIIAPTRELVMQIAEDAKGLCRYSGLNISTLIGGMDYDKQLRDLDHDLVDIVVATPGRLIDFMSRKDILLDQIEVLVLDEADRMLDMGFIPQVKQIIRMIPDGDKRQTLLFSATFTTEILELSSRWTRSPVHIDVEPDNVATDLVEQKVFLVSNEEKFSVLLNILRDEHTQRAIIFGNRRDQTQNLHKRLTRAGIKAGILSGEISQSRRTRTLADFKKGVFNVLVATDVAGRGIHVDDISHVINYHLPDDPENYVHRIGRTGRAGSKGISISLACENEAFSIPAIEALLGRKLKCELPPATTAMSNSI